MGTDWVKNTEDTENPQKTQKLFLTPFVSLAPLALTSLRLCFLCAFAFILGDLKIPCYPWSIPLWLNNYGFRRGTAARHNRGRGCSPHHARASIPA